MPNANRPITSSYDDEDINLRLPTKDLVQELYPFLTFLPHCSLLTHRPLLGRRPPHLAPVVKYPISPGKNIKVKHHKHSLVLCSDVKNEEESCSSATVNEEEEIICDGCIEPITAASSSSSYYKCTGDECNFFLHIICAHLKEEITALFDNHRGLLSFGFKKTQVPPDEHYLRLSFPERPWEVVKCNACGSFCSGYSYKCENCDFLIDLKCSSFFGRRKESIIKHKSHKHPLLVNWGDKPSSFMCNACGASETREYLHCEDCGFKLGFECALLPPTAKHRFDEHELVLSFPPYPDIPDKFYCEVCQEEIHPKHWSYRCAECDRSFHPSCIPTLGACRNIKFGRTLTISRHPHRLTLVPDGRFEKCDNCYKQIQWQRAFECAQCKFYLCPECAAKEPAGE